jgi:hypothetical protein
MAVAAILIASLTLHVTGTASRGTSGACGFTVSAKVAEGGRQVTCLTSVRGYPGPGSVIRSAGTMTFVLSRGTIRTRVAITQRFAKNGSSATRRSRAASSAARARTPARAARSPAGARSWTRATRCAG